jgi:hypothetical protein
MSKRSKPAPERRVVFRGHSGKNVVSGSLWQALLSCCETLTQYSLLVLVLVRRSTSQIQCTKPNSTKAEFTRVPRWILFFLLNSFEASLGILIMITKEEKKRSTG